MVFYSTLVVGLLLLSLWSDRRRPRYLRGMLLALLLHGVTLLLIRPLFPFKTVLAIVPTAFFECVVLVVVMLRIVGDQQS
jgi:hypothetical protein